MNMAAEERDLVRRNTPARSLRDIDQQIENNIAFYSTQPESAITERIKELEAEWGMERWLEANASALAFSGTVLGLTVNKKWFVLPLLVTDFLFQHAVQPAVPVLRKAGIRTRGEIDREKFALKLLRGDFNDLGPELREHSEAVRRFAQALAC